MNEWVSDRRQEAEPPFEDDMERPLYVWVVRLPVGEEVCLILRLRATFSTRSYPWDLGFEEGPQQLNIVA